MYTVHYTITNKKTRRAPVTKIYKGGLGLIE